MNEYGKRTKQDQKRVVTEGPGTKDMTGQQSHSSKGVFKAKELKSTKEGDSNKTASYMISGPEPQRSLDQQCERARRKERQPEASTSVFPVL